MGDIDINVKNFVKINSVFAQLFSQGVYGGQIQVDPQKLCEFDTAYQDTIQIKDDEVKNLERLRDAEKIAMIFDNKITFQVILGIETQSEVHYYMPVRCMELDALTYSYQCKKIAEIAKENGELNRYAEGVPKGTKIPPTVTLVFYTGSKPWDGPVSVYDMLDIPDSMKKQMKHSLPNYSINLIDARHMSDDEIDKFEGDLKVFLLMLRERFDRKKLKSAVTMHRETWYALSKIKNDNRYTEYINSVSDECMAGGIYMDAALDYIMAEGEARGTEKGEENVNRLGLLLLEHGRIDEFLKSLSDKKLQKKLFAEFGIEKE